MKKNIKKSNLSQPQPKKVLEKALEKKPTKKVEKDVNKKQKVKFQGFKPIMSNVAGIDIGSTLIHVAIINENSEYEVREFGTYTTDLNEISRWLVLSNIKDAAMEATGVYWVPLFEILEDNGIRAAVVDPKRVKNVPGKKTDVLDCQWIHRLYSCGLLSAGFRPKKNKEAFRSYIRHRGNLIRARQTALLQINKSLLLMNVKLDVVVSEVGSVTGIKIIRAIVEGERDPEVLAKLRHYSCSKPENEFIAALTGNFQKTHVFTLKQSLKTYDYFREQIDECDKMILEELLTWETIVEGAPPLSKKRKRKVDFSEARKPDQNEFSFDIETILYQKTGVDLTAINSLGNLTVATIVSEIGGKEGLNSFVTEKHWTSWLALCPGNNVSGGKSHGGQSRKAKNRIKRALLTASMSLCNSKCALGAYYRRLASRVSKAKALKAVAHKLARLIYNLLKHGTEYVEIGQEQYENRHRERKIKNLIRNAKEMGYELKESN
jgi:transposase